MHDNAESCMPVVKRTKEKRGIIGHIGVNMDSVGDMWPIAGNRDEIKEAFGILYPQVDAFVQEVK